MGKPIIINEMRILAMCQGKQGFDCRSTAMKAISRKLHIDAMVFHCEICKKWHIGSTAQRRAFKLTKEGKRK